jgi:hypothetical protein
MGKALSILAAAVCLAPVVRASVIQTYADQEAIPNHTGGTPLGAFAVSGTPDLFLAFTLAWNTGLEGSNKFVVLYFGDIAAGVNFGLKSNQGPGGADFVVRAGNTSPIDYAPQQVGVPSTIRLIGRIQDTDNSGDYDAASLWVDPEAGDLATPDADISGFTMTISPSPLGLRSVNLAAGDDIDLLDIVVTDDFASAVPEPSFLGLAGLSGVGLLLRRRRTFR